MFILTGYLELSTYCTKLTTSVYIYINIYIYNII